MNNNQAEFAGKKDCRCSFCFAVIIVMIITLVVGITVIPLISSGPEKTVNVTKLLEKFDIQEDLWKTLISAQDDPSKQSNERINTNSNLSPRPSSYYIKAKSYEAILLYPFIPFVDDFTHFSTQIEIDIQMILVDVFELNFRTCSKSIVKAAKKIIKMNKSAEFLTLKTYMKKMQEDYVKQMIKNFQMRPEELDATPEYFCEAFGFCSDGSLYSDGRKLMFEQMSKVNAEEAEIWVS